jgi:hypothetical protein
MDHPADDVHNDVGNDVNLHRRCHPRKAAVIGRLPTLRYLGGISGTGIVTQNGKRIEQATFDFDGYFQPPVGVTVCGQIQLPAEVLKSLFGCTDLKLLTDQDRLLNLSFSDSKLPPASYVAHVDVRRKLPTAPGDWCQ